MSDDRERSFIMNFIFHLRHISHIASSIFFLLLNLDTHVCHSAVDER